jgi:hypothetical protein
MSGSAAVLLVILIGGFGAYLGWNWKLMHRSWQDYGNARKAAKRGTPALRTARSRNTWRALLLTVVALLVLLLFAKSL